MHQLGRRGRRLGGQLVLVEEELPAEELRGLELLAQLLHQRTPQLLQLVPEVLEGRVAKGLQLCWTPRRRQDGLADARRRALERVLQVLRGHAALLHPLHQRQ